MTFKIHTLGCKVNLYESEAIASELVHLGLIQTSNVLADVHIINTCTVTKNADDKSKKAIRSIIKKDPTSIVIVMGCYVQLNHLEALNIEGVNAVIGTNNRLKVIEAINEIKKGHSKLNYVSSANDFLKYEPLKMHELSVHTRGFVKIQDGCNNFCSYCAIPYARGPIKSREVNDVIEEIKCLVKQGVKEVVISGINTGTYGQDLGNIDLSMLIEMIIKEVPNIYRLRLSSIELKEVTDKLLDLFEKYPNKLARHLHIPLQGTTDKVLLRMNRKYNIDEYITRIKYIQERFPKIAITTDCLAGFVGETEAEFEEGLSIIKEISFAQMHIFPYSRRKNTLADQMEGHLTPNQINNRAEKLLALAQELKEKYQNQFINQTLEVLFEQKKNGYWLGHTSNYLTIAIESNENLANRIVNVKIDDKCKII